MEKITDKILELFDGEFLCPDGCGDWSEQAETETIKTFISKIPPLIIEEIKRRMPKYKMDHPGYDAAIDFTKILNEII